ncbi:MAG: RsbRD N-terminal domain-containing protein [Ignavibacteriae bacterium]|nr:RsbRD N-terminal domain-containing protein [Ignavibacteriota bacterium]
MKFCEQLEQRKSQITEKWLKAVIETYPDEAGKFLFENKNQFGNPIGFTFSKRLPDILDELINPTEPLKLNVAIEDIIKIRTVQDFTPSEAVGFLYLLKKVIRKEYHQDEKEPLLFREMLEFESRIDQAVSLAFDIYVELKEKIYEIKAGEVKARYGKMVDRFNEKYGD